MRKTIGVIGGMGPLATVKLFEKIVIHTKADSDQEHPHTIIDSNTDIPDRTAYILGGSHNPKPQILISAKRLEEAGADFLVMPCNTAHYFYNDISEKANIPFINMIEETVKSIITEFGNTKVGILATDGTQKSGVYGSELEKAGLEYLYPDNTGQKMVMDLIYNIKKGKYDNDIGDFISVVDEMYSKGARVFILGCTELSVAADLYRLPENIDFVDALVVLAKAAILKSGCDIES